MIYIGSDHAGFKLKKKLVEFLIRKKQHFTDLGCFSEKPVDYPDIAKKVAIKAKQPFSKGVLICGTGIGMCMAANKIKGVRAAQCYDSFTARMAREHNDANVLCLRSRNFNPDNAKKILNIFLTTKFSAAARHKRRIKKVG